MTKLWGGRFAEQTDPLAYQFNASLSFDQRLWDVDIRGSTAWAMALARAGVLTPVESVQIVAGLQQIHDEFKAGVFAFAPTDEDIHTAVERRLTEIAGPVGGKLHTGRSRNDQVATDLALFVQGRCERGRRLTRDLMARLLTLAEAHRDWPMPGYTHLQRAQPVYLAHHLLAYFWMFDRDLARFGQCYDATADLPLGAGALAGVNWNTSRVAIARELGFDGVCENTLD